MRYDATEAKLAKLRSHKEYVKEMKKAEKNCCIHYGIKGKSIICDELPYFDGIWGFPPDWMHAILIGVVKSLWKFWTTTGCQFKLTKIQIDMVDARLIFMKPTKDMYRLPNQLRKKSQWKAADWLNWLFIYSIPCLRGILNDEALNSYSFFVRSMLVLAQPNLSNDVINKCENDLKIFVNDCQKFYNLEFMTFNVHIILHLCNSIRKSGPLYTTSAFPFESAIGGLKKLVTGPTAAVEQITGRVLELNHFNEYLLKDEEKEEGLSFCKRIMLRRATLINFLRSQENAIIATTRESIENKEFDRCIYNNKLFHSVLYTRPKKTDNTFVQLKNQKFSRIQSFFLIDNACYVKVQEIEVEPLVLNECCLNHIFLVVKKSNSIETISISDIEKKVVLLNIDNEYEYICVPPSISDAT